MDDLTLEELEALTPEEFQGMVDNLTGIEREHYEAMNMDDGPFYGTPFEGDLTQLDPDQEVFFIGGKLLVFNREKEQCPVLAFRNASSEIEWAVAMDPSAKKSHEGTHLEEIVGCRLKVESGHLMLHYTADWNYGTEHGYTYFGDEGEFLCFYLSW